MSTLDKIGALLAKAEATDNEHERDAFMSKAQELATLSAIDLEAARQRQKDKTKRESPVKVYKVLLPEGVNRLRFHFIDLFSAITRNNDVRFTYWDGDNKLPVNMYGFPSDIEVCELLFGSLAVQMTAAADAYIKTKAYKGETYTVEEKVHTGGIWGRWDYQKIEKPVDARVARNQFYDAFTDAIFARLSKARKDAQASVAVVTETGATTGALVLKAKSDEVDAFYRESVGRLRGRGSSNTYRRGGSAGAAGRAAGESARLGTSRGIGSRAGAIA